ncbi:MAG: winged helix-turn-helix domain-containing protein [Acidobacteria bacterium]|nr:winged helix-turn-helix domain-containing protein [Acidobacteriota bacterium]
MDLLDQQTDDVYEFGPYLLEPKQWRLRHGDGVVALPPKAFALLLLLLEKHGELVTKNEVLARVWADTFVEEGNVAFYVAMLRKALSEPANTIYIETIKTRGYRFVAPVIVRSCGQDIAQEPPPVARDATGRAVPPVALRGRRYRFAALAATVLLAALASGVVVARFRNEPIDSVVVMPFHAIAPVGDQAYLESGMAESIALRLGNLPALRVPPLAAVRRDEDPFEAGKRLGTQAVLTGAIQRAGERLLITTELSRVNGGGRLWSWSFDTTSGEILTVQNEIAERIAVRLGRELKDADRARLSRRDTASGQAYDLFLQGRERWRMRTPESIKQAIGLYERAITIDPQFSRAYAGLADCYNIAMSGLPPEYRYPRAKENAEKAIGLDPDSAEAHTSLAFMRYKFEWRWQDADDEFRRAIKLNPRYQLAHHWYGEFLGLMDRTDEAIAELKTALELDPLSLAVRSDMARPLMRARRLSDARAVLEDGLRIDPAWYGSSSVMAEILALEGRDRESAGQTWRTLTLRGVPDGQIEELRTAFEKGGMPDMIRAQIRQWLRQDPAHKSSASFFTAQYLSFAYARLGEREDALRWLETSIDRREDAPLHMLTNWAYESIRDDPRFAQTLERLNLTQGLKR